jgi:tetratricopeptide (TPR) repeat protein
MRAARIVTHRVESDETWQSIARDFYGDGRRAAELARDNGMKVEAQPLAGSAVRVSLSGRDVKRLERRLDAAREYNEGLDLASKGSYAAGAAKFEEALKLDPSFRDASFNLALCYGKLSLHKRAAEILEELVATHSESNEYRYALGASRFGAGDLGGAEKTFKEVLAREPAHGNALFSLAVTLEKRGKQAEAAARFRQYLLLEPAGGWAEAARSHLEGLARAGGGAR